MDDASDIYYLHELIAALDRRRHQPGRRDAEEIARTGAALRKRALRRLTELGAQARSDRPRY